MQTGGLMALALLSLLGGRASAAEPRWLSDYAEARKLAARTGKPLFVVFRCPH